MPEFTSDTHGFPEGALVGAYLTSDTNVQASAETKPLGAPADAVFVESGVLTFDDLDPGSYQLVAPVNGLFVGGGNDASFVVAPRDRATVRVELIDPEDTEVAFEVAVDGRSIEVTLATDSEDAIVSTALDVVNALNGIEEARALVTADLSPGHDGSGVLVAESVESAGGDPKWRYVGIQVPEAE